MATRTQPPSVRAVFSSRRRWMKGQYSDGHGRYCLYGAINLVCGDDGPRYRRISQALRDAVKTLFPTRALGLAQFNDHEATTFADIQRVVRRARV